MALEDLTLESLAEAPPNQPTADDIDSTKAATQANVMHVLAQPSSAPSPKPGNVELPTDGSGSFQDKLAASLNKAKRAAAASGKTPSWAQLWMGATTDALATPPTPAAATASGGQQPSGQWEEALANRDASQPTSAGVQPQKRGLIGNALASLGDTANASGGGGLFGGVARTAAAKVKRTEAEQQNAVALASANAQMIHSEALTHKMGEDAIAQHVVQGQAGVDAITTPPPGGVSGTVDYKDKTSDELKRMITPDQTTGKSEIDMTKQTVFATGRRLIGKDANGLPLYQTTYSVVTPAHEAVIQPKMAEFLNKYAGTDYPTEEKDGAANKGLQVLPGAQYNLQLQQAYNAQANEQKRDLDLKKHALEVADVNSNVAAKTIGQSKLVTNALASASASPTDPYATVKAYNALKIAGKFDDPASGLDEDAYKIWAGGGGKDSEKNFEKMQDSYATAQQKNQDKVHNVIDEIHQDPTKIEGHVPAVKAAAQAILDDSNSSAQEKLQAGQILAQAKAVESFELEMDGAKEVAKDEAKAKAARQAANLANPLGLTGDAFIKTLPPARANTLRAFDQGLVVLNPSALERTDKGLAFLDDVYAAYPDLDTTKAPAYAKMRVNFTTGKEAQGLNQANTSIHHLGTMYSHLNDATAGWIGAGEKALGGNTAGQQLADDAHAVADELGKLYSGGVVSDGKEKEWQDKLNPFGIGMTVEKLRKNIKEFTILLGGKMKAFQDQWDDGVPSAHISAPKSLASVDSQQIYKNITGEDLQVHPTHQTTAPTNAPPGSFQVPPDLAGKGTTVQAFTKNGVTKMLWTDASGKPLREAKPGEIPKE